MQALTRSAAEMIDGQCQLDKMAGLRGGRELTTTQVTSLGSRGESSVGRWMRKVPATARRYLGRLGLMSLRGAKRRSNLGGEPSEIATPRQLGARSDKSAWCWMKQAAAKSWRRDLQMTVSSLVFGTGQGTMASLLFPLDSSRWRGEEAAGAGQQDDYFYPRGILHREGAGRSWATKNTSNISGVE